MKWPVLPRLNPCLPCLIGNPLTKAERQKLRASIGEVEALATSADPHTKGYVAGLRRCERQFNPAKTERQRRLFGAALAVKRGAPPGRYGPDARRLAATVPEDVLREAARGEWNPYGMHSKKAEAAVGDLVSQTIARSRKDGPGAAGAFFQSGYTSLGRYGGAFDSVVKDKIYAKLVAELGQSDADRIWKCHCNPKLMVLNPGNPIEAAAARKLGRALTSGERAQLQSAVREYRTFHGRDPDSIVPVEVPRGTPRFVNLVGDVDRIDYTVRAESERRGRWTHRAGDHGRTGRRTRPALLVSVPGKRTPPVFAQRAGSDLHFKPTHGIVG